MPLDSVQIYFLDEMHVSPEQAFTDVSLAPLAMRRGGVTLPWLGFFTKSFWASHRLQLANSSTSPPLLSELLASMTGPADTPGSSAIQLPPATQLVYAAQYSD